MAPTTLGDWLTGDEWFNGLALGAEPLQNAGSLFFNAFSVAYS
ncbi:hypothetical protein [Methylobacterium sp. J-070]|nr:hypothetical protein [Methylobacterium sp. J-070]